MSESVVLSVTSRGIPRAEQDELGFDARPKIELAQGRLGLLNDAGGVPIIGL